MPLNGKKQDKREDSEASEDMLDKANFPHCPNEFTETNHTFGRKLSNSERNRPTDLNLKTWAEE